MSDTITQEDLLRTTHLQKITIPTITHVIAGVLGFSYMFLH